MMAALRRQFRCVGYELPEGGPDGARLSRYQHADLVSDLFALLDPLRHSTSVCVRIVVRFDDRARRDARSAGTHPSRHFAGRIRLATGDGLAAARLPSVALWPRADGHAAVSPAICTLTPSEPSSEQLGKPEDVGLPRREQRRCRPSRRRSARADAGPARSPPATAVDPPADALDQRRRRLARAEMVRGGAL